VLRRELGSRYTVTPSMMATGFGKKVQGNPTMNGTEIDVSPGATYFGLIRMIRRAGFVRKVYQALEHAPDFARPD
jgi:hypothetical protein